MADVVAIRLSTPETAARIERTLAFPCTSQGRTWKDSLGILLLSGLSDHSRLANVLTAHYESPLQERE